MAEKRMKKILQTSIAAICVNAGLGVFKAVVGMLTHSIAITMDAINNFTDAASSFITILSAYFVSKTPDKKHPFGYGRTEYLGTLLIGGLILYAGITSFVEAVKKIFSPEPAEYSTVTLIIIVVAILIKAILAVYMVKAGKETNSGSLIASGKEATADIAISVATVVAALVYVYANISLEAWLGAIIALVIIKAGVETLKETVDKILGTGGEVALVQDIKKTIAAHEDIEGAFDLVLHNYGPDSYMGSVHIAVADTMDVNRLDVLSREVQDEINEKFGVYLSAIGIYSVNTKNEEAIHLREEVRKIAMTNPHVHQMHGFFVDFTKKNMRFDLVISFEPKDRREVYEQAVKAIQAAYPEYSLNVGLDSDFNECL